MRAATAFFGQVAVLTALLYYFGFVRSYETFSALGIEPSTISFSTADYVVRSGPSIFPSVVPVILAMVLGVFFHRVVVVPLLRSWRFRRRWARRALSAGTVISVLGLVFVAGAVVYQWSFAAHLGVAVPVILATAAGWLLYAEHLRTTYAVMARVRPPRAVGARSPRTGAILLVSLCLVGSFWALSLRATSAGDEVAHQLIANLKARPPAVVYATQQLDLENPKIEIHTDPAPDAKYHFKYTGLRLLTKNSSKFFLVPEGWKGGEEVIVLPDNDGVRVDMGEAMTAVRAGELVGCC